MHPLPQSTRAAAFRRPALSSVLSEVVAVTITRIGTNEKYQAGWSSAFGGKKSASKATAKKVAPKKKASPKKTAKKGRK